MHKALARVAIDAIRRWCNAPEALTVSEWADRERMLPETSTSPGPYRSDVVPYARRPQDLLADPEVRKVVLCWAAQTTKSTVIENGVAYRIARMPSPMVIVQPKIDAAEAWAKERFVPMVLATPALRERVRLGRSTDSTLRYKRFPGGFAFIASAQSAAELASRSAPFLLLDEVDRYEPINEGNPVEIAMRRQGAADVATACLTSTPGDAENSVIWPELEGGTFEVYDVPCPHCGTYQPLVWRNLRWAPDQPETAHYVCEEGCVIEERHKRAMLAAGRWRATNAEGRYPSFHLNALYSPFGGSAWPVLAEEWLKAQGKSLDLQVFVNTRLAEVWQESAEAVEAHTLAQRLEPLPRGVVPVGAGILTAGVDVQANRVEVFVWGWGDRLESWLVEHEVIGGDPERHPTDPEGPWPTVAEVLRRRWPTEAGHTLPITAAALDTGYATTAVYRFLQWMRSRGVFGVKGVGGPGVPLAGKVNLNGKERVPVYPVGTDAAKNEWFRSHLPAPLGPAYVHLMDWTPTDTLEQLVGEKRIRRTVRGRVAYQWVPKKPDQPVEALDCRVYARAALEVSGAIAGLKGAAERVREAPAVPAPPPPPVPEVTLPQGTARVPRPRTFGGSGWVGRWR